MQKALGSRKKVYSREDGVYKEFTGIISDILYSEPVQRMNEYDHHMGVNRLQHCINVAYYSYVICRKVGADSRAAARAGLMHDLFFYDWREREAYPRHRRRHPRIAADNAQSICELSVVERDIILTHMWPSAPLPRFFESFVVSFVDKVTSIMEITDAFTQKHMRATKLF